MTLRLTDDEASKLGIKPKSKKSKYNSKKIYVDGICFDSKKESEYYNMLKILSKTGQIDGFARQARFIIIEGKNSEKGTEYVCDFIVFNKDGTYRIVDVKGVKTDVFKIKVKAMREKYPNLKIELEE